MCKPNRNGTSEAIRLPNVVVDFLKSFADAKGIDKNDLAVEIIAEYIAVQKVRLNCRA